MIPRKPRYSTCEEPVAVEPVIRALHGNIAAREHCAGSIDIRNVSGALDSTTG
jgi:hypothetical protein